MVYPALLTLMRTPRLPAVDWTDSPADLNGLVRLGERRNLVSARVPSGTARALPSWCLSGRMEQVGSSWTDFHEGWHFWIFREYVMKVKVSLQSHNNNSYFTWRPMYIYYNILLNLFVALRPGSGSWPSLTGFRDHTRRTHHTQYDFSRRVISSSHRPLPNNIQHLTTFLCSRRDSMPQSQQASGRRPTQLVSAKSC